MKNGNPTNQYYDDMLGKKSTKKYQGLKRELDKLKILDSESRIFYERFIHDMKKE